MKRCARCGEEYPRDTEYFAYRRLNGAIWLGYCRPCERARAREQHAATKADPERLARYRERKRDSKRRQTEQDPEHQRELWRRSRRQKRLDPERHAVHKEHARIDVRLRLERQGRRPLEIQPAGHTEPDTGLRHPAEPFVRWLRARWPNAEVAAEAVDLAPRLIRAYYAGTCGSRGVSLRIVDHAVTRAGFLLHDVYDAEQFPELYD